MRIDSLLIISSFNISISMKDYESLFRDVEANNYEQNNDVQIYIRDISYLSIRNEG